MNDTSCIYRIDESDRITYVSPTWSMFAEDNDAPELSKPGVVGRGIWDFIVGEEIRIVYREVFRQVRENGGEFMLPFRCDSPDCIRHMELILRTAPGRSIEFEARLILSLDREEVSLFAASAERSNQQVPICSFCRRIRLGDEWLSAGDAVTRRRWFGGRPVPKLSEALCADCLRRLHQDLGVR